MRKVKHFSWECLFWEVKSCIIDGHRARWCVVGPGAAWRLGVDKCLKYPEVEYSLNIYDRMAKGNCGNIPRILYIFIYISLWIPIRACCSWSYTRLTWEIWPYWVTKSMKIDDLDLCFKLSRFRLIQQCPTGKHNWSPARLLWRLDQKIRITQLHDKLS